LGAREDFWGLWALGGPDWAAHWDPSGSSEVLKGLGYPDGPWSALPGVCELIRSKNTNAH
jgi:hypothetical protein